MVRLKLKQLESHLGEIDQFDNPKIDLEQYPTSAHIASRMLYMAEHSYGDLDGRQVADLGCGCGVLGIGAAMLGAEYVLGVDVDADALALAQRNCEELEVEMEFVQCDLRRVAWKGGGPVVDAVVMNPPFGTRRKGADMEFLQVALKTARRAVYSLHKSSTREHIKRAAVKDFGARTAEVLCQLRYDLPALYKFHKKREVDIEVDLWRFEPA